MGLAWKGANWLRGGLRLCKTGGWHDRLGRSLPTAAVGAFGILPAVNDRDSCRAAHAAPRRGLVSRAAAGTSPLLTPPPRAFRVCASPAATFRPSTRMF